MGDFIDVDVDPVLLSTDWGTYPRYKVDEVVNYIVDKLTNEKMTYEEAIVVLRRSESLVGARARLQ